MNAAEYLLGFFEMGSSNKANEAGYKFPDVVAALAEVESAIDSWALAGMDVHLMRQCLARWKSSAINTFTTNTGRVKWSLDGINFKDTEGLLSDGDLMGLQTVAEKMSMSTVEYSETARDRMSKMIDEAIKCGREDDSLPDELVVYIARLGSEARTALDEYDLTGDFKLSIAFDRLSNALRVAEAKTKHSETWKTFREQFMIPLLAQVGVNAVVWGLSTAQVLPQIGS